MSWLNITRNLDGYGETAVGWLQAQDDLWVITTIGSGARLRKATAAVGSPAYVWEDSYTDLPASIGYSIQNSVEDTENSRLFISNFTTGEVYYNITGDPSDGWGTILSKQYGEYNGEYAKIRQLAYYNKQVYIAHKGGVSVLNYSGDDSTWTLVGDFTEGFDGIGECYGFYVLNNELYITVAFGDLGVIYKYNAEVVSLIWIKVAELPAVSITPQYLTARNNILFTSNDGVNQNIFNSRGIDTTLTGQPRFTQGTHLTGGPSSIITHSTDNFVYATCWDVDHVSISDTYTDNLISVVRQAAPYSAEPGETFFTGFTPVALSDYTVASLRVGGNYFNSTKDNPDLKIKFRITSNALELLPGETYTVVWEYGFHCTATAISSIDGARLTHTGSGPLKVGFKSNVGTGIDGNSPGSTLSFNAGSLFALDISKQTRRATFTFDADDIASTTDGEFIIEGTVAVAIKGAERWRESWTFLSDALIKNIKLLRGDAEAANATYVPVEYIIEEYADVPDVERERHAIEQPSPPDQWFIKFAAGRTTGPENIPLIESDDERTSTTVDKLSRLLITNRMKLLTNTTYRMHVLVNREDSDSGKSLKIKVTPSIRVLAGYTGAITSVGTQNKIVWEFNTASIPASMLAAVRFRIDAYEENIQPSEGGSIYISDINLLGTVRELPVNTIFRYDGEVWDDNITKVSDDGGIVGGHPHKLVQSYEVNSVATRLYCLSDGDVYVWGIGADDPYGGIEVPRIIIMW
jgi:hypothetical protein